MAASSEAPGGLCAAVTASGASMTARSATAICQPLTLLSLRPDDRVTIFKLRFHLRLVLLVVAVVAACLWTPLLAGQQPRPAAAATGTVSGPLAQPAPLV